MGYYIQGPAKGKAEYLRDNEGGTLLQEEPFYPAYDPEEQALIVVVDNGVFEAAAYAYSEAEWEAFHRPGDFRPKKYVVMDSARARELSGYRPEERTPAR